MTALFLAAQLLTATPGVDCSRLTADQAKGQICATAPATQPVCDPRPDPYREPDRASACSAWDREHGTPVPKPGGLPPANYQMPLVPQFQVGKAYRRDASGSEIFVIAIGAGRAGFALFATECLNESVPDGCFFVGQGRLILANANSLGWTEIP